MRADLIYLHQTIVDLMKENQELVDKNRQLREDILAADERASENHEERAEKAEKEALELRSRVYTYRQKLDDAYRRLGLEPPVISEEEEDENG